MLFYPKSTYCWKLHGYKANGLTHSYWMEHWDDACVEKHATQASSFNDHTAYKLNVIREGPNVSGSHHPNHYIKTS
jgi:hypothetical protein